MLQIAPETPNPPTDRIRPTEPEQQAGALGLAAARALRSGDAREALAIADSLVRAVPKAPAMIRALRADALRQVGRPEAALDDLREALKTWPDNELLLLRLMGWAAGAEALEAARRLGDVAVTPDHRRRAALRLFALGEPSAACLRLEGGWLRGWLASSSRAAVTLRFADASGTVAEEVLAMTSAGEGPDEDPPFIFAALLACPPGGWSRVEAWQDERCLQRLSRPGSAPRDDDAALVAESVELSVILPVYGDLAATRACLESLDGVDMGALSWRIILVDDASPEPGMAELVREFAARRRIRALANPENLGFAASVNRALALTGREDVILLNADTLVPPGAFARLRAHARRDATIGTITPLSGNGELVSVPRPFVSNELPDLATVRALDDAAALHFAGRSLPLPSGIGFCLYVTRACLDRVGRLPEAYGRGYGEDIAFCLEAGRAGLANVCALDTYVGHHGTLSFQGDKPLLVSRNLRRIEAQYPDFRAQCEAFMAADPLRELRRTLLVAVPPSGPRHVLAATKGAAMAVARARGARLAAGGAKILYLELDIAPSGADATFWCSDAPHDGPVALALETEAGRERFARLVDGVEVTRLEVFGHGTDAAIAADILAAFRDCVDLVWIDRPPAGPGPDLTVRYSRILAPTEAALREAMQHAPAIPAAMWDAPPAAGAAGAPPEGTALALLLLHPTMEARRRRRLFARAVQRHLPGTRLVILGAHDIADSLFSLPDVRLTGPFAEGDIGALVDIHAIGAALVLDPGIIHGHPVVEALRAQGLPVSFIDDISGAGERRAGAGPDWLGPANTDPSGLAPHDA